MEEQNSNKTVLVTGASGYLASHVIHQLLKEGYKVKGTVRDLTNPKKVEPLYQILPEKRQNLSLVEADLLDNSCWNKIVQGVDYIIHTASPFPSVPPDNENLLIKPAVEGTESVLKAALQNGVKKVVITSSIAAIFAGRKDKNDFNDKDFSDEKNSPPYEKSKLLAEQAAWRFYEKNKDKIELTIINPGFIQGPSFHSNPFTSTVIVQRALNGDLIGIPQVSMGIVDVRDVALAHVRALQVKESNGKRYILVQKSYWMQQIIQVLREEFEPKGYKLPTMIVGSCMFGMVSICDKSARLLKPFYGRMITFENRPSVEELKINYTDMKTSVIEMAYDLIKKGFVQDKINNKKK